MRRFLAASLVALLPSGLLQPLALQAAPKNSGGGTAPIQHLVIIFQENVSFDHYFGTYPNALNPGNEPAFTALPGTPAVNGYTPGLMLYNPNALNAGNGTGAVNPFRLDRTQAATSDQDHNYLAEQQAFHNGLMDLFPAFVGTAGPPPGGSSEGATKGLTMGYYDGNTVTALWNYAQRFAMSDNSYGTTFGPSTPGAINVVSGQTDGAVNTIGASGAVVADGGSGFSDISDADPTGDMCSSASKNIAMNGTNIGEMLTNAGITWGWFEGGFNLSTVNANGTTSCGRNTTSAVTGMTEVDYIPHHQPFQYYASTANPTHKRPTSTSAIGSTDQANHQYDIQDFYDAVNAGNFPAVSYLKASGFQDGHAGYSDPLDEQNFVVGVINFLMKSPYWANTAVIINYDDSDGWYDHQIGPIVNQSATAQDALTGPGACGSGTNALPGVNGTLAHAQGRCGYGPRLPIMVISPWAKQNFVDHTVTDQSSIVRFIEDTWLNSARIPGSMDAIAGPLDNMFDFTNLTSPPNGAPLILDPSTGLPAPTKK